MRHRFMHARCARRLLLPVLAALTNICAADESSSEAAVADNVGPSTGLPEVVVVGSTPLVTSDLNRDQVPQTTRVLDAGDINRSGIPTLTGAILDNVASAMVNTGQHDRLLFSVLRPRRAARGSRHRCPLAPRRGSCG